MYKNYRLCKFSNNLVIVSLSACYNVKKLKLYETLKMLRDSSYGSTNV